MLRKSVVGNRKCNSEITEKFHGLGKELTCIGKRRIDRQKVRGKGYYYDFKGK